MATHPEQPEFAGTAGLPSAGGDEATQTSPATLLFRRYRVIRELGRGGMGVVMLAHDTALDIPVAVKLVPEMVVKDTESVADLRKEVLRGMALAHPGIVRTHNFDRDESGAGIIMEYIDGETLTELKQRQPGGCFDPEQILPWVEQLCGVLEYAHREAHIVHRDLKPRNVMIAKSGRLKVADFGIAAVLSDSMSRHSMEGRVSGTLSYMSPQQVEGKRPSHLDDIHALGATLFELLTGRPPFFRGNQAAIFQQVLAVAPPTMAERREELEVVGKKSIPKRWEEVIAACLAKDPARRPQSAGEVFRNLALSAGAPAGGTGIEHVWERKKSRPVLWIAFSILVVVLGIAAFLIGNQLASRSEGRAGIAESGPSDRNPRGDTPSLALKPAAPSTLSAATAEAVPTPRMNAPVPIPAAAPGPVATPSPTPTPPPTPAPPPARVGVVYRGTITVDGNKSVSVPLSVRFDQGLRSGISTQGSAVGDTVVTFSGSWEGRQFRGTTGDVVSKPERVKWDPEVFTLDFEVEGGSARYSCEAGGRTYKAEITAQ